MKTKQHYFSAKQFIIAIFLVLFFSTSFAAEIPEPENRLFQISTLQALIAGEYDGSVTVEELLKKGNTGLGTFDKLDGEMLIWQGVVYKARADGKIYPVDKQQKIPFANIASLGDVEKRDLSFSGGYESLKKCLDALFPAVNLPVIFLISGEFTNILYRSVPAQQKPYPPLTEVVKEQSVFTAERINGVLIGFRFPEYMKGLNIQGYHLHFISENRKTGGHLFKVDAGKLEIQGKYLNSLEVVLPESFSTTDKYTAADETAVNKVEALSK